jgi:hypothetical protein
MMKMPIQKRAIIAIVMVAFLCVCPAGAWAELEPLTDAEMDEIYAQGIFVDFNINIIMPRGPDMAWSRSKTPIPNMPSMRGNSSDGISGSISVVPAGETATHSINPKPAESNGSNQSVPVNQSMPVATAAAAPENGNSTANNTILPSTPAVSIAENSMGNNSGLIITAPGAAVSLQINVAVFNNSVLNGDFMQSAQSSMKTFAFSFSSFGY